MGWTLWCEVILEDHGHDGFLSELREEHELEVKNYESCCYNCGDCLRLDKFLCGYALILPL